MQYPDRNLCFGAGRFVVFGWINYRGSPESRYPPTGMDGPGQFPKLRKCNEALRGFFCKQYVNGNRIKCDSVIAYVISHHDGANGLKSESRPVLLIMDDDEELNALLKVYLSPFGWEILSATRPEDGLNLIADICPTLVILDVMLPGKDGFEICSEIRTRSRIPIIMLTARGDVKDRVRGLQLGADDYLPKPFEPTELVARIQSVLRRIEFPAKTGTSRIGELTLNGSSKQTFLGGKPLDLTGMEFAVLELLVENAGTILSRDTIALRTKGVEWEAMNRTIDVLIGRLRGKLGDNPHNPRYIKTVWGEGYLFIKDAGRDG